MFRCARFIILRVTSMRCCSTVSSLSRPIARSVSRDFDRSLFFASVSIGRFVQRKLTSNTLSSICLIASVRPFGSESLSASDTILCICSTARSNSYWSAGSSSRMTFTRATRGASAVRLALRPRIRNLSRARTRAECVPSGRSNTLSTSATTPYLYRPVVIDGASVSGLVWHTMPIGMECSDEDLARASEVSRPNSKLIVSPGKRTRLRVGRIGRAEVSGSLSNFVRSISMRCTPMSRVSPEGPFLLSCLLSM